MNLHTARALLVTLPAALLLAACSDDSTPIGSGSGAGDDIREQRVAADIATLTPFEGIYDLTGNWRNQEADAAFLIVRTPADDGVSEVVLSDVDEGLNCTEQPRFGVLLVDDAGGNRDVFLNDIFDLNEGVVSLGGDGSLSIEHEDVNDVDGDGDSEDRTAYTAPRVAITEQDLPAAC